MTLEISSEYRSDWDEINRELQEATAELTEASERYNRAILARIAIVAAIRGVEWQNTRPE